MDQQQLAASAVPPQDNVNPFDLQPEQAGFNPDTLIAEQDIHGHLATTRPLFTPQQTPRDSSYNPGPPSPTNSSPLLAPDFAEKGQSQQPPLVPPKNKRLTKRLFIAIPAALVILALVIVLPIVLRKHTSHASSSSRQSSGPAAGPSRSAHPTARPTGAITGGDGSTVTKEDGTTFIYNNSFGGIWFSDPTNPFRNDAYPNSWTPPLNTSWRFGTDRIYGVNLGGWFVMEPFITPALYQKYTGAIDEWTLSEAMRLDTAGGGIDQLEQHYDTFITEEDFAQIAAAGLNWVRVPIPFWAIDTWEGEPFLARTCWKYILRMFSWARKYGLRVNLDLHTCPGSQNTFNHSGRSGALNFLYGVMGVANAQRVLNYIRIITEFISQPEYTDLVPIFSVLNEPLLATITRPVLGHFYLETHRMIREIAGTGAGHGPFICIHDGFLGPGEFEGFLTGSDRIILDTHPYFAFNGESNTEAIGVDGRGDTWPARACAWTGGVDASQTAFGVTLAGEWSTGFNDCGVFLKGVGATPAYGGDCTLWENSAPWNATLKAGLRQLALAQMDAFPDWFFWTWKVGATSSGIVGSPLWSYKHGLDVGYIPTDPRDSVGVCAALTGSGRTFGGTYLPWQTGGPGAGTISAAQSALYLPWPPRSLVNVPNASLLPTYTSTGSVSTLPPPTLAPEATATAPSGWVNPADTGLAPTPIAGCTYPDAWAPESDAVVAAPPRCS